VDPVCPQVGVVHAGQVALGECSRLVLPLVVSRVIDADDRPAPEPRNCSSAGPKSPVGSPCRYSSGNTSLICGDRRHHAGRIADEKR
jgi:hypothetical protein